MRKLAAIAVALGMLTMVVPASMGYHVSVGFHETNAGPEEAPAEGERSVAGTEEGPPDDGEADTPYELGTTPSDQCYDAEPNITADEATSAATSHAFCGQLIYNENTTFQATSFPDQHFPDPNNFIGEFDVQRTYYVGNLGLYGCGAMCDDSDSPASPGNTTWQAFHTVGQEADLTDNPEKADEEENEERDQSMGMQYDLRSAPGTIQDQTGIWQMDGWQIPYAMEHFVGFVFAGEGGPMVGLQEGDPVSDAALQDYVEQVSGEDLNADSVPRICGYHPDFGTDSTGDQDFCQDPMLYDGPYPREGQNDGSTDFRSYDDKCGSPTYVCSPTSRAQWSGQGLGIAAYGSIEQLDYIKYHWVIAPHEPDCAATEPGFGLDTSGGPPYLAQDLDVYTPVQSLSIGPTVSTSNLDDYSSEVISELQDGVPGLPLDEAEQIVDNASETANGAVDDATSAVVKSQLLEPNHVGAENYAIDDNSRSSEQVYETRSLDDPCEALLSNEEPSTDDSEGTVDPWVNYINNQVHDTQLDAQGFSVEVPAVGLYGTDTDSHDEENDPTTDIYSTSGFVGVFTDKDDDGEYDQVLGPSDSEDTFGEGVYQADNIQEAGAYPMLWDMWVKEDTDEPEIATDQGCDGPGDNEALPETMRLAGYGPNTGIAQAIYLAEPTAFYAINGLDTQVLPYPAGNNIYVLGNQAVHELWDEDPSTGENPLDISVDQLVSELQAYVTETHQVDDETLQVHTPAEDLNLDSAFSSQCGQSTGDYSSSVSFAHTCEVDCSGDTIATMYSFEVREDPIGAGSVLPKLTIGGEDYNFGEDQQHTWYDIDPFDGDDTRNEERMDPPPTGE